MQYTILHTSSKRFAYSVTVCMLLMSVPVGIVPVAHLACEPEGLDSIYNIFSWQLQKLAIRVNA